MATANHSKNSEMTSEAYDLLDCFVQGLDDVIYEIAETIAREKVQTSSTGTVEIRRDDVKEAALALFRAIREEAGKSLPAHVARHLEEMHDCVIAKCRDDDTGE
jgi:hypothetical protein